MENFNLRKYLAENKLVKENINLYNALDTFENLEDEFSYNPSFDGIQEIGNFIDFLRERHPNGVSYDVDLDNEFAAFDESEYEPSYKTHVDIQNFISFLGEFNRNETFLENKLVKEGIENEVDGLRDFLRFKNVLDTHTVPKHADDEDQRRWQAATEELDDVLTNWLDLLAELDRVYPT